MKIYHQVDLYKHQLQTQSAQMRKLSPGELRTGYAAKQTTRNDPTLWSVVEPQTQQSNTR